MRHGSGIAKVCRLSRRKVLVSGAAAGGGLALGLHLPEFSGALAQKVLGAEGDEVGAWVVIRPNDDVVIRIARTEMGQGTLTGLAQLVAEELECDWKKVKTEMPTPGQNLARNRVWRDMATGGSRGIRGSQDYVRQGGAAAREMLIKAAAEAWKVPAGECKAEASVITHTPSGRKTTYGKVAAAAKLEVPKDIKLKDPKDWKIVGKPLARLDTADKLNGKKIFAIDVKLPGMLNAAIKDFPVFGSKIVSFDAAKVSGMPGVRHVVKVNATAVAVVADTWWQAKKAVEALPVTYEESPNIKVSSATIAEHLKGGLTAQEVHAAATSMAMRSGLSPAPPRRSKRLCDAVPQPCLHGADELHGQLYTRALRGVVADPERRRLARGRVGGVRIAARQMRGVQDRSRWRLRPARRRAGLRAPGGADRQADPRRADQVGLVARRGHDTRLLPSDLSMQVRGRPGRQQQSCWPAPARFGPVDQRVRQPGLGRQRQGRPPAAGLWRRPVMPSSATRVPNLLVEYAMRNTHVPVGPWRGVNTNQNAVYLECFMDEVARAAGRTHWSSAAPS